MAVATGRIDIESLPPVLHCPKCDDNIYAQSNGSCLTQDIAHQHETVDRALDKLDEALLASWHGYYRDLRIIVGGGQIRDHVLGQLHYYRQQQRLLAYHEERNNRGAIVVSIRR